MPRELTAEVLAAVEGARAELVHLLAFEFSDGTIYLTTGSQDIIWDGHTWEAVGGQLSFGGVEETRDQRGQGVDFKLSGVDQTVLAVLLTNNYRGRPVKVYRAHLRLASDGPGATAEDTFTDSAGTLLQAHEGDLDAVWEAYVYSENNAQITVAGRLRGSDDGVALYYASHVPPHQDYTVSADLNFLSLPGNAAGVIGRLDADTDTYYSAGFDHNTDEWQLKKVVAGAEYTIASIADVLSAATNYRVALEMFGTHIRVRVNGEDIIDEIDDDIAGPGFGGIFFNQVGVTPSDVTGPQLDNFRMHELIGHVIEDPYPLFQGLQMGPYTVEEQRSREGGTVTISTRVIGMLGAPKINGIQTNVTSHSRAVGWDTFFQNVPKLADAKLYWGTTTSTTIGKDSPSGVGLGD